MVPLAIQMKAILRVVPLLVAGSVLAQGSFDFEAITGYGQFSNGARDVTVGWSFRVHSQIKVTALGCFSDIIAGVPVTIGLWSSSQALLSSTSIAAAGAQAVTYSSIAPVMLDAGQTYFIGAFRPGFIAFRITGPGFGDLATLSSYLDTNYVAYAESASQQFAFRLRPRAFHHRPDGGSRRSRDLRPPPRPRRWLRGAPYAPPDDAVSRLLCPWFWLRRASLSAAVPLARHLVNTSLQRGGPHPPATTSRFSRFLPLRPPRFRLLALCSCPHLSAAPSA
jgi:hypothetical protein